MDKLAQYKEDKKRPRELKKATKKARREESSDSFEMSDLEDKKAKHTEKTGAAKKRSDKAEDKVAAKVDKTVPTPTVA